MIVFVLWQSTGYGTRYLRGVFHSLAAMKETANKLKMHDYGRGFWSYQIITIDESLPTDGSGPQEEDI